MSWPQPAFVPLFACAALFATANALRADEGMWLFSRPPLERIARDHAAALGDTRLTPEWLAQSRVFQGRPA